MKLVQPELKVLSQERIQKIHSYSLEILARVGIRVDSPRARKIFGKAIKISKSDKTVRIPADLVEHALATAPATVDIYDRLGNFKFQFFNFRSNG